MSRITKMATIRTGSSFAEGISRIVDLGGTMQTRLPTIQFKYASVARAVYRTSTPKYGLSLNKAVSKSLASDWKAINQDLGVAAGKIECKYIHCGH